MLKPIESMKRGIAALNGTGGTPLCLTEEREHRNENFTGAIEFTN